MPPPNFDIFATTYSLTPGPNRRVTFSQSNEARSDGPQALLPAELVGLVSDTRVLAAVTGRRLHAPA